MNKKTSQTVVAVCYTGDHFQAAVCRRHGDGIEVQRLCCESRPADQWQALVQDLGLSDSAVVMGLDSVGVLFCRLEVPQVGPAETEAMIRVQLESRLPLEPEQMRWAWRRQAGDPNMRPVVVAAARKRWLDGLRQQWGTLPVERVLLQAEALVRVWQDVFETRRSEGVVISVNDTTTDVCVARDSQLVHAAVLDVGQQDLDTHEGIERLLQDLSRLRAEVAEDLPLFLLSDGSAQWDGLADTLKQVGLSARVVLPDERRLNLAADVTSASLYQGRVALGLALLSLDQAADPLELMPVASEDEQEAKSPRAPMSLATAAILLVLAVCLWVGATVGTLTWRKHCLEPLVNDPNVVAWMGEHQALKATAGYRPDLLALLKTLNEVEAEGIILHDLLFKRGQAVKITGQAKKSEPLYQFEQDLNTCKGIKNAVIEKHNKEAKGKKIDFTLTFDYKNFTQKTARY